MTLKLKDTMWINYKRINSLLQFSQLHATCDSHASCLQSLVPFTHLLTSIPRKVAEKFVSMFSSLFLVYFHLLKPEAHCWMKYLTAIIYWGFIVSSGESDPPFITSLKVYILIKVLQLIFSLPRREVHM